LFAYQKKQQVGLFLKDLIPLAAIGRAYVWRAGEEQGAGSEEQRAKSKEQGEVRGSKSEVEQERLSGYPGWICQRQSGSDLAGRWQNVSNEGSQPCKKPANFRGGNDYWPAS